MPDTIKLSLLSPHPTNPRQISDRALGGLKRSIKLGMQYLPAGEVLLETIVVNQNGNRILSGHQRVRAMQEEGVAEIAAKDVKWVDVPPDSDVESAIVVMLNSQEISGHYTDDLKMFLDDIIANQPELSEDLLFRDLLEKEFGGGGSEESTEPGEKNDSGQLDDKMLIMELMGMVNATAWSPTGRKDGHHEILQCAHHEVCQTAEIDDRGNLIHHPECRVALLVSRDPLGIKDELNRRIIELGQRIKKSGEMKR